MQNIGYSYIDRKASAALVLKDYRNMAWKLENAKSMLELLEADRYSPKATKLEENRVLGKAGSMEDAWVRDIEKKETLQEKIREVQEFMAWFEPCWQRLSTEEQGILSERYMVEHRDRSDWLRAAERRYHYSRTTIYEMSDNALVKLAGVLF